MTRSVLALAAALIVASCAVVREENSMRPLEDAACAAQGYLRANGFLNDPVEDASVIELRMWDRLQYESDGVVDWETLLAERHGVYQDRLHSVARTERGHVVLYRIGEHFTCLDVSGDLSSVCMHEASCRLPRAYRLSAQNLRCG